MITKFYVYLLTILNYFRKCFKKIYIKNNKEEELKLAGYINDIEKSLEKQLSEKEKILKDKDKEIKKINKILNEREKINRTLKDRENTLNNKENKLKEEENKLKEEENKLKEEEKKLKEKEKKLNEKGKRLKEKEKDIKNKTIILQKEKESFEKEKELDKLPILIGLNNIGATCYMNATLQALSNTNKLTKYFLNEFKYEPNNTSKIMSNEFYKVLTHLWDKQKRNGSYSPDDFKKTLSQENSLFEGIQANDSKDLINFLIERFHTELNNPNISVPNNNNYAVNQLNEMETLQYFLQNFQTNYRSIISDLFYGVLETKTQCSGCQTIKYNFQIYSLLEFPLEQVNIYCFNNGKRFTLVNNDGTNPDVDLYECFDYYQKMDMMMGDNQMYCNFCQATCNALYNTSLYSLPNYLIINLNRGKNAAYKCNVNFPAQLNLLNYVSYKQGVTVLNLYAVICHYGPSSMSGHFIAYCHNEKDKKWYKYNDSIVSICNEPNPYNNGMPYILFYKSV